MNQYLLSTPNIATEIVVSMLKGKTSTLAVINSYLLFLSALQ